jgi:hypothetical protein
MGNHRMLSCRLSVAVGHRLGRPINLDLTSSNPAPWNHFLYSSSSSRNCMHISAKNWDDQRLGKLGQSNRQYHNNLCWIIRNTILVFPNCKWVSMTFNSGIGKHNLLCIYWCCILLYFLDMNALSYQY